MSREPVGHVVISKDELDARLARIPRVPLVTLPTPVDEAPRLSLKLGRDILFKREDLTGLALGGNKSRMFEYLLAEALARGADAVVAGAAAQSNYCRQLAAAGAKLGLRVVLVLRSVRGEIDHDVQGNLLLDVIAGAEVTVEDVTPEEQALLVEQAAERVRQEGGRPYLPQEDAYLGAVAYVACGLELLRQLDADGRRPAAIYLAAAAETQGGLVLAMKALGHEIPVVGVNPGVDWWDVPAKVAGSANRAADRLELDLVVERDEIVNTDAYVGPGYGYPTAESVAALKQVAELEGLLLDPVYTSKAMAALMHDAAAGSLPSRDEGPIVFLHTGGVPALFHYRDALDLPARA